MIGSTSEALKRQVRIQMNLGDEELYVALLPEETASLYNLRGRILEGKRIFMSTLARVRPALCEAYGSLREDVPELTEIAVVLALALEQNHQISQQLGNVPLVPFCILAVRQGMNRICQGASDD